MGSHIVTGCVWIVPGDPGHTGAPVEIRLPSTVTVRFSPAVTVSAGGRTLRAGDAVIVEDLGPGEARPDARYSPGTARSSPGDHCRGRAWLTSALLSHAEPGVYLVGMRSYGRAPTFLAMIGYEQVRSVAADTEAAERVELAAGHRRPGSSGRARRGRQQRSCGREPEPLRIGRPGQS